MPKHDEKCPDCGRFVSMDADGWYSRIDPYLVEDGRVWEDSCSYMAVFCNEKCADQYDAAYKLRLEQEIKQ